MRKTLLIVALLTVVANAGYNKIKCNGALSSIDRNTGLANDSLILGDKYMAKHHMGLVLKSITRFKSYCGNSPKVNKLYTEQRAATIKIIQGLN